MSILCPECGTRMYCQRTDSDMGMVRRTYWCKQGCGGYCHTIEYITEQTIIDIKIAKGEYTPLKGGAKRGSHGPSVHKNIVTKQEDVAPPVPEYVAPNEVQKQRIAEMRRKFDKARENRAKAKLRDIADQVANDVKVSKLSSKHERLPAEGLPAALLQAYASRETEIE